MSKDPVQYADYELHDGLLMYHEKLLLDPTSPLITQVLQECHSTMIGGHGGIQKTTARICAIFTWKGVKQAVKKFLQEFHLSTNETYYSKTCWVTPAFANS